MSESEGHQVICLTLGTLSGVCLTLFFIEFHVGYAIVNLTAVWKVVSGINAYDDAKNEVKSGNKLIYFALLKLT